MKKIETVVQQLKEFRSEKVSVHKILQSMEDSGFPAVLLMLSVMLIAIPIPKIPPFNFFFGIPLLLFGWQMLKGQDKPSLPRWLEKKKIATEKIKSTADRIYKLLEKVEKIAKPCYPEVANFKYINRIMGAGVIFMTSSILLPLPGTSSPSAFLIAIMCMGKIYGDSRLIVAGLGGGVIWIVTLFSVIEEVIEGFFKIFY